MQVYVGVRTFMAYVWNETYFYVFRCTKLNSIVATNLFVTGVKEKPLPTIDVTNPYKSPLQCVALTYGAT